MMKRRTHRRTKTDFEEVRVFQESLRLEHGGTEAGESESSDEDVKSAALAVELKQISLGVGVDGEVVRRESARTSRGRGSTEENFRPLPEEMASSKFASIITIWREMRVDDGEHNAEDFAEALESLMMVIEALGTAFQLINMDVRGKCKSIIKACTKHSAVTLQRMIDAEKGRGPGTEAVLWMKRTLQFTDIMMTEYLRNEDLPGGANTAYKATLHDCHPFVVRSVASNIRMVVPSGTVFCGRLDNDAEKVKLGIREFLVALKVKLRPLIGFFNERSLETVKKCRVFPVPL